MLLGLDGCVGWLVLRRINMTPYTTVGKQLIFTGFVDAKKKGNIVVFSWFDCDVCVFFKHLIVMIKNISDFVWVIHVFLFATLPFLVLIHVVFVFATLPCLLLIRIENNFPAIQHKDPETKSDWCIYPCIYIYVCTWWYKGWYVYLVLDASYTDSHFLIGLLLQSSWPQLRDEGCPLEGVP